MKYILSFILLFCTFGILQAQNNPISSGLTDLQQTVEKQRCGLGGEKLDVTANYYRNGGKIDVYVTYPDKPTNDQIKVTNLTAYVYERNNLLKKQVKNGETTLVAGGKQVYIQMSGIYPKDSKTSLDVVVTGDVVIDGFGIGGSRACGTASIRTE
jgi:hypothetical protein